MATPHPPTGSRNSASRNSSTRKRSSPGKASAARASSSQGPSSKSRAPRHDPVRLAVVRAFLSFNEGGVFRADPPAGLRKPEDKRLYVTLLRGLVRHRRLLESVVARLAGKELRRLDAEPVAAVMLGLFQLRFLDLPSHAAVYEAVALAAPLRRIHAKGWINALLRAAQREGYRNTENGGAGPSLSLAQRTSHPDWMVERWTAEFGAPSARAICQANNLYEGAAVRVESRRIRPSALVQRLQDQGITAEAHPLLPGALWVEQLGGLLRTRAFREGLCYVQDVSSQLLAAWVSPLLQGRVLDVCTAPGGKLTQLRGLDPPGAPGVPGRLLAGADRSLARMSQVKENLRRLRLPATPLLLADGERLPFADGSAESGWDSLLIDAPCSATGMIRKYPELKWRKTPEDLPRLAATQRALLAEGARVLRPGGRIVYATCSLEPEENGEVVSAFLKAHPAFRRRSFHSISTPKGLGEPPEALLTPKGDLLLLPGKMRMGLYAAVLEKRGEDGGFGMIRDAIP